MTSPADTVPAPFIGFVELRTIDITTIAHTIHLRGELYPEDTDDRAEQFLAKEALAKARICGNRKLGQVTWEDERLYFIWVLKNALEILEGETT